MRLIPRWNVSEVSNSELFEASRDGGKELNAVTGLLVWYLYTIGIPQITPANFQEVWRRVAIVEALTGGALNVGNKTLFMTFGDIVRHIGLVASEAVDRDFQSFILNCLPSAEKACTEWRSTPSYWANDQRTAINWAGLDGAPGDSSGDASEST